MYCLSHQLAVKFYWKWKHSQVFALPSPMGNHKSNPCLQQECPPDPSGHYKRVNACRGGQTDPEFVFSLSPSCASAAFGRRGCLAPCCVSTSPILLCTARQCLNLLPLVRWHRLLWHKGIHMNVWLSSRAWEGVSRMLPLLQLNLHVCVLDKTSISASGV